MTVIGIVAHSLIFAPLQITASETPPVIFALTDIKSGVFQFNTTFQKFL
jgi:hypothetical protein